MSGRNLDVDTERERERGMSKRNWRVDRQTYREENVWKELIDWERGREEMSGKIREGDWEREGREYLEGIERLTEAGDW